MILVNPLWIDGHVLCLQSHEDHNDKHNDVKKNNN